MADERRHQPPLPWRLVASTLLLANALSIHYGCQMTMTNPSQAAFMEFVNASYQRHWNISLSKEEVESQWSVIVSLLFVSGIGGSLTLGLVARHLRRKAVILVSCAITVLSHLIAIVSYFIGSHYVYALSRVVFGFGAMQANSFVGVFVVEVSPMYCRGRAFVFLPLFLQLGTVVGALIAVPSFLGYSLPSSSAKEGRDAGNQERWWMMYAGEAIYTSIAILIIALWMPETPTELVRLGLREKAQDSLRFYRAASEKQAEIEYDRMAEEEADRLETRGTGLWELWSARSSQERRKLSADRRGALTSCVVLLAQVMSGICALNAYTVDMLSSGGVPIRLAEHSNVVLALLSMIGAFVSGRLVEKFGRRGLLLSTYASLVIANLLFVLFSHLSHEVHTEFLSWAQVITLGCFMAIFSVGGSFLCVPPTFMPFFKIGPGPVSWMVTNEMVSHESRPATQGSAGAVQAALRSLQLAVFLPLKGKIGTSGAYGSLFLVPLTLAVVYMYYFLPETRARTVEQVQTVAINQLPTLCKRKPPPLEAEHTALALSATR